MRWTFLFALLLAHSVDAQQLLGPRQFIDQSVVTFPRSSDQYVLADIHYDPQQWTYGITSKWAVNTAPDGLRLTVFVYPVGSSGEADAVAQQMDEIELGMRNAVQQGVYSNLVIGKRTAFVVVAPKPSFGEAGDDAEDLDDSNGSDLTPQPEFSVTASDDSGPIAQAIVAGLPSPNSHGQRQAYSLSHEGVPTRSLAYVFYRHLFAIKVRVSAPAQSMDNTTFEALADTATRRLVPRVYVENYGQCGAINVPIDKATRGNRPDAEVATEQMLMEIARVRRDNCATFEGAKRAHAPRAEERVDIVYPPDAWRSAASP